jgi:hypothetical protein
MFFYCRATHGRIVPTLLSGTIKSGAFAFNASIFYTYGFGWGVFAYFASIIILYRVSDMGNCLMRNNLASSYLGQMVIITTLRLLDTQNRKGLNITRYKD